MRRDSTAIHPYGRGARGRGERVVLDRWVCENAECDNAKLCWKKRLDPVAMAPRCYQCGSRLAAVADPEADSEPRPNASPVRQPESRAAVASFGSPH